MQDHSSAKSSGTTERSTFRTEGKLSDMDPAERDRVRKALFSTVNADFVKQLACGKAEQERCDG